MTQCMSTATVANAVCDNDQNNYCIAIKSKNDCVIYIHPHNYRILGIGKKLHILKGVLKFCLFLFLLVTTVKY